MILVADLASTERIVLNYNPPLGSFTWHLGPHDETRGLSLSVCLSLTLSLSSNPVM